MPRFPVRFDHKNQSFKVYNRCGLLFSVQSLNNFLMMSIRNCSVGSSGDAFWDASTDNFSWPMSHRIFFRLKFEMESFWCGGQFYFSLPIQLPQSSVTRNATSVEFARNTIGDLDRKHFEQQQWIRNHPRWYKKYYWPGLVKNKKIAQCRQKK